MPFRVEQTMHSRLHRRWQAALEGVVDLHGPPTCRFVTFELCQDKHEVLPQIPKRFHVLSEKNALASTTDLLTGVGFEQREHARPDVPKTMLARAALDEIWKREQSK
jgi:hypothetical protein